MKLIDPIAAPTEKQLSQFGWLSCLFLPCVAWWWTGPSVYAVLAMAIGSLAASIGSLHPMLLKPSFIVAVFVTRPFGVVIGEILMAGLFFGIVTPIGLIRRMSAGDPLHLNLDSPKDSFWLKRTAGSDVRRYRRMY